MMSLVMSLAALLPTLARAQPHCPTNEFRVYAHNDYENAHPLNDAIALGLRGVEADVFLIDGVLRVGHDRKQARRGPTLDTLYLQPIRDMFSRCAPIREITTGAAIPFLLNIEVKEQSKETSDALTELLQQYARLTETGPSAPVSNALSTSNSPPTITNGSPRLRITMVGITDDTDYSRNAMWGRSCKASSLRELSACLADRRTSMLSIDYGKTMGRWWTLEAQRDRWMVAMREAKATAPGVIFRVYNVPVEAALYHQLYRAGADVIGTERPEATARALRSPGR